MADSSSRPALCFCDDATFWPWLTWPEIGRAATPQAVVLVPVAGLMERSGLPLNAEEGVLMRVVQAGARGFAEHAGRLLVVPPLRFVAGPTEACAFPVDPTLAHAFIAEVCRSIMAAGFRRVVLCNASPWNEELCDVAARDLRINLGLQMFCVHLSGLGLDFKDDSPATQDRINRLLDNADPELLAAAGGRLAGLLGEMAQRPPLRDDGRLHVVPSSSS